ncbi:MAG: YbjN domain-containing protein [Alphaproteobacteria bacterium]|nr:YbjN domain-containing protein [Alphaproteobacteria bacterium]
MKRFATLIAAGLLIAAPAIAQNQGDKGLGGRIGGVQLPQVPTQPQTSSATVPATFTKFDAAEISALLIEMGMKDVRISKNANGQDEVLAASEDGLKFNAIPAACQANTGCLGLDLYAWWTADDGKLTPEQANNFNKNYRFAKAYVNEAGEIYLSRYVIADYGIPRDNLKVEIYAFLGSVDGLYKSIGWK